MKLIKIISKYILCILFISCFNHDTERITLKNTDIEFINEFFDGSVNPKHIDVYETTRLNDTNILAYAIGNTIVFREDLEFEANPLRVRSTFAHELTHVWQYQHLNLNVGAGDEYYYGLYDNDSILDYGREQQAEIIEAYYTVVFDNRNVPNTCMDCSEYDINDVTIRLNTLYIELISFKRFNN